MTINLSDNSPRVIYTVAAGVTQSSFTVPFDFFEEGDVNVYVDGVLKTITTDYTVTGGSGSNGTVAMSVTGISGGSSVVLTRDLTLERTTDFPTSGPFDVTSLNRELDRFTAVSADLKDQVDRALQLTDYDADANLTLPDLNSRKGKVLAFDATTGDLVNGPSTAGVTTVAAAAADIATLADIEDGTVATDAISDAAAIASDITTVAGIASNVTTVAGNTANVNTVAGNTSNINTVAGNNANVTTVAGISGNVTTAAGISADITAVAADATDIGTVSTNIANVNTVAGISADVTTVAADGTDIGVVAGISSDVTTVSGIAANVTSVAGNTTNINSVAADATDIGTVATNIANVNTVAGIDTDVTTVAGIAADVIAAATNASDISAIAAEVAKVVTVANDLNEATSEIDVVANNIANVNLVGSDISNVNIAATSLTNIANFNDIFVAGASAPSSPDNGDLWYDTVNSQLKVYVNSSFQIAGAYLQGLTSTHVFTATAAQTTFTTDDASNAMSIYSNGNTLVFLNGIRLVEGSSGVNDYYIDGNSVELNSGAAAGDVLYVEVFTKVSTTQETSLNQLVTDATTQATAASTSAAAALVSENAAAANLALTNADVLLTNADVTSTNADVTSTNADVVLTNADVVSSAASAAAAATSETNAAASATQAAASAGGGTLKITSNDTTADVLGNKIIAGTGVTATTNNAGGNETLTLSVNPFSLTETTVTATSSQTVFTVSYTAGLLQVFMNGIKLSGSDFTATNGTSVTLASGAAAGDLLEFVVFG